MTAPAPAPQPKAPLSRYAGMTRAGLCVMACANVTPAELTALIDDGGVRWLVDNVTKLLALKSDSDRLPAIEKLLRQGVELAQTIAVGESGIASVEKGVRDWLRRVEWMREHPRDKMPDDIDREAFGQAHDSAGSV